MLSGGDRRSIGMADAAADILVRHPERFEELWSCLAHPDPIVRMRAADALEKATRNDATKLQPRRDGLLDERYDDGTAEVRWHLLVLSGRLRLDDAAARKLLSRLRHFVEADRSRIVRTLALQTAVDLAKRHPQLKSETDLMIRSALASDIPSLQARARKLRSTG